MRLIEHKFNVGDDRIAQRKVQIAVYRQKMKIFIGELEQ